MEDRMITLVSDGIEFHGGFFFAQRSDTRAIRVDSKYKRYTKKRKQCQSLNVT